MYKEGCKGCLIAVAAVFTFVAAIVILLLILRSCTGRAPLNQEQIIQFVHRNEELLNQAVEEIWSLDEHVSYIANTRFSRLRPRGGFDFDGLYTGGVIAGSGYVITPLDNPILYELLQDRRITSITVRRATLAFFSTYQIQIAFNVGGVWDRYGGIYFSKNDEPLSFEGRRLGSSGVYRDGWVRYGNDFYYTERIIAHWFYYEMLFNSNRRPQR